MTAPTNRPTNAGERIIAFYWNLDAPDVYFLVEIGSGPRHLSTFGGVLQCIIPRVFPRLCVLLLHPPELQIRFNTTHFGCTVQQIVLCNTLTKVTSGVSHRYPPPQPFSYMFFQKTVETPIGGDICSVQ